MKLRRLNDAGMLRLTAFLESLRTDEPASTPEDLLNDAACSEELPVSVEVERRSFRTRFEAAEYLNERMSRLSGLAIEYDKGLWAWLSLFYFEQLCPPDRYGRRKPGELARWIPEIGVWRRYYRHLLAGPYRIYRAHRDDPVRALALLCGKLNSPGDIAEQLASRQELVTNRAVMTVSTTLCVDRDTRQAKRGSGSKGPGSPRRLADILNQFDVTWDLYAMAPDDLMRMLPREFNRFRPDR